MLFGLLTARGKIFVKWDYRATLHVAYPIPHSADALATLGARESAGMVFTLTARIFRLQHQ